jgi:hypothetical protein
MSTRKRIIVAVSVCLSSLLLATAMSAVLKKYEERPFRVHGDTTVLIDWANPQTDSEGRTFVPWTMTASEVATDGWFKDSGAGVLYLDTLVSEGSGECCECNGGTIAWESIEQFGSHHVTVKIVSGTGQFEGAHSQYEFDYTPLVSELNEDGNPVKLIYSFWGEGKLGLIQ